MSSSDSMFLFELTVEKLKYCNDYETVYLKANFKDVFEISLKNPHANAAKKKKAKVRDIKFDEKEIGSVTKIQTGQSLLICMAPQELLNCMRENKLELSIWSEKFHEMLGSKKIPWSQTYRRYISVLETIKPLLPAQVKRSHRIFHSITHQKIAIVKLNIKLTYLGDKEFGEFKYQNTSNEIQPRQEVKYVESNCDSELGIIKTTYSGNRTLKRPQNKKPKLEKTKQNVHKTDRNFDITEKPVEGKLSLIEEEKSSKPNLIDSRVLLKKNKSLSSIEQKQYKTVNYIFGDPKGPFGNKVYCVNYCTVEKGSNPTSKSSAKDSEESVPEKRKFKFKTCDSECEVMKNRTGSCPASTCTIDINEEAAPLISVKKCKQVVCDDKKFRELPPPPDDRILVDMSSMQGPCCDRTEKVEEILGGVTAKLNFGEDPCYCTCECKFGFVKRTKYCAVCGGFEKIGEDVKTVKELFPCPLYHKLMDKSKLKAVSSGSDTKAKKGSRSTADKKSVESEKDKNKCRKILKDERFVFDYGYKGIPPQIGHSRCAFPCTGTMNNVPKRMGWLWTAEDVPGLKFRPGWRPGATNKHVVRLLRMAKNPGEALPKKRRRDTTKKKPLVRPLLIVQKQDGEFTVTMETMKAFPITRPRAINQNPYEDKPVITYTIGRTEEENRMRMKKKDRDQRRLERDQRAFIQSAFRDMCRDICLKTYQQALGFLPDTEDPDCTCFPTLPTLQAANDGNRSCPCSDDDSTLGSDTDSDEWVVEFTPPCATFNPTIKVKKVQKLDNCTQYTYLDYKVKLFDRYGNPVVRFFKGPDGRTQCSDLGGFWGPDKQWVTINVDGFVAPDDRWCPNTFIGPNGETVEGKSGKFQTTTGKWVIIGVDGYVDCLGRWKFYSRPRGGVPTKKKPDAGKGKKSPDGKKGKQELAPVKSEASWSCFGGASAKELSKLGIVGHGHDKKLLVMTLKELLARGEKVKIPKPSTVYRLPDSKRRRRVNIAQQARSYYEERTRCKHPTPSEKGIVAVDDLGNKTYFQLKERKNARPKDRLATLADRGISLSSFHVPCLHSFVGTELMKKQLRDHIIAVSTKNAATQKNY